MTACASCGADNATHRKFCADCGAALARPCLSCGTANEPGARFCGECGAALDAVAGPAAAAERRLVSVLFVDLVGFTTLADGRDPEDVRELLSRYFDVARTLVGRYGGTIEKFIGDAVMAVWGTPVAREDDAERAVRAALDLVAAVAALGEEADAPIRARAGVVTGEAAVTIGAEGQGMVAGDLVNTAARVQSVAEPGTVLVNDATRRASSAAIGYADAGEHELKGKPEPLQLARAEQVTAAVGGAYRSAQLEPPFVGREREFRLVKEVFHAAADDGVSRLLTVVGIAGIGKSRLAWEFEKYVDGLAELVWWHRGRCLAYGDGISYWALAEMVRMRAGIADDDAADEAREKLRSALADAAADEAERAWLEARVAHLLGLAEGQTFERQDLFAAWRLFFERLSDQGPVVLVFEDLQWADTALLDFVEHLLDWSRNHPIFVLALTRPELSERRATWGTAGRSSTALTLEPLSDGAMRELLGRFVPGLPDELGERILARSQGVPLYAVETVRMLLDRGLLKPDGERFALTGDVADLEVPETLHALVAARIDDLSPAERAVIQDASVLGKTFTPAGLTALSGSSSADLEPLLRALVRKEVLSVEADPRSPERGQYGFLQDLLQRVAYETLSRADRRARHLAAAAHLERVLDVEGAEVVAAHYVDAHRADPNAADAPAIRAKAAEALTRAGRRAASLGASEEAERSLLAAADLVDDTATRAELYAEAGDAGIGGGRWEAAQMLLERAAELFTDAGEMHAAARVAGQLGWAIWMGGDLAAGLERIEASLGVLADAEPDADLAALIEIHARLSFFVGDLETCAARIERVLEIAEALVLTDVLIDALNTKHLLVSSHRRREEAMALIERAVAIGRERPPSRAYMRALYNLSYQHASLDRSRQGIAIDEHALELARRRGERHEELWSLGHLAIGFTNLGLFAEAERYAAGLSQGSRDLGPEVLIPAYRGDAVEARRAYEAFAGNLDESELQMLVSRLHLEAEVLSAEGRSAEALDVAARGWSMCIDDANGFTWSHPVTKWLLAALFEAAFDAGEREVIETTLRTIELAPPVDRTPFTDALVLAARGRLSGLHGDLDVADELLRDAIRRLDALEYRVPQARTLFRLGELLASAGRTGAADALAESRAIFVELGADAWVERIDALRVPSIA